MPLAKSPKTTSGGRSSKNPSKFLESQHRSGSAPSRYNKDPLAASPKTISQAADKRSRIKTTSSGIFGPSKLYPLPSLEREDTRPVSPADGTPANRHEQLKAICRHLRKHTRLRDKILESRTKLEMEQRRSEDHRGWVSESLERFMSVADNVVESGSFTSSLGQMSEIREQLEIDHANLKTQEATIKQIQSDLANQEYFLMQEEKELGDLVATLSAIFGFDIDDSQYEDGDSIEPPETRSEYHHPLAAEYYARKGDVGILVERLADMDYEHRMELADRELKVDQELPLVETESQFRRRYEERRQQINVDIIAAENDARRLEDECRAAGLELEPKATSSHESEGDHIFVMQPDSESQKVTYIVPGRQSRHIEVDPATTSAGVTTRLHSESTAILRNPKPIKDRELVHRWLDDIASDPPSISLETELDQGRLSTRNDEALTEQDPSPEDRSQQDSDEDEQVQESARGVVGDH